MISSYIDSILNTYKKYDDGFDHIETKWGTIRARFQGQGNSVIVMVPDGPCVIEHFDELVSHLKNEYRILVFDMPGFGGSSPSKIYDHSIENAVSALQAVLDHYQLDRVILNFTCVNGYYALAFASRFPQRVQALILGQTPSIENMKAWVSRVIPKFLTIPAVGQIAGFIYRKKFVKVWFKIALPKGTNTAKYTSTAESNLNSGGCNCLASVVQAGVKIRPEQIGSTSCPVYMMWGLEDRSHKLSQPSSLSELVPTVKIEKLDSCGHFPNLEAIGPFIKILKQISQ